jgi:hypothetical protein
LPRLLNIGSGIRRDRIKPNGCPSWHSA